MFSFFRKNRFGKETKSAPQSSVDDDEALATETYKKKAKSDKKTSVKEKKVSFKSDPEVVPFVVDTTAATPPVKESVVVPVESLPVEVECESPLEERADVFCEAFETIETIDAVQAVALNCTANADSAKSVSMLRLGDEPSLDSRWAVSSGDVNRKESIGQDVSRKLLPIAVAPDPPTIPFLTEGSPTLHNASNDQGAAGKMSAVEEQGDVVSQMKEQLDQLESELRAKNERMEQLEALLADDDRLAQLELVDSEREEELRLLQEALEEALEEKAEMEAKMLRDASRESQLLDDFEWKLGEIERDYKKKLLECEKAVEERVKKEMAAEFQQLVDDKRDIDEKLTEIAHLKSYEAEVTQLRGLIHEQQRAIRVAARQVDQLRVNERLLQDDLNKIRTQGCTRKQQQEMEEKWEEKTQTECSRLRAELIATNEEEMLKAIRQVVHEKDDQINCLKRQFDSQLTTLNHQMAELKNSHQQREAKLNKQLEMTRTAADRELCDLRRQLNKVQDSHVELMEQMQRKHAEELERCGSIIDDRQKVLEQDYDEKLQSVQVQHQSQLDALQALIEEEKQEALTQLGEHYQNQLQSLQDHIGDLQKRLSDATATASQRQIEIGHLHDMIEQQEKRIEDLQIELKERDSSNPATNSRRPSSDGSTASDSSASGDGYNGSTLPTGRSAGDGCSPSTSAAASQDNLRPSCQEMDKSLIVIASQHLPVERQLSVAGQIEQLEHIQSVQYCDDPEHVEAQQIILEMHQVLADRDAELQRLTEEKRFYQLELIHWERNLALQRVGLPLALVPDRLSNESELNPWRGYSAPPVTKPRLPDATMQLSASAAFGSQGASYELFSPSATSLSPERQLYPMEATSILLQPGDWLPPDELQLGWPSQPVSHIYYSDDDDDDSNNNGFTTPL